MGRWNLFHFAISSCISTALLAGCGGSQPPIGAQGVIAQISKIGPQHSPAYLYVANQGNASAGGQRIEIFDRADPSKGPIDSIRRNIWSPTESSSTARERFMWQTPTKAVTTKLQCILAVPISLAAFTRGRSARLT